MNTLHRAALALALAAPALPAFAFYQVVEETARLEVSPGNVKTQHWDYPPSPEAFRNEVVKTFDQSLDTATSRQYVSADLIQTVPARRGDFYNLSLTVFASATGSALTNITQKADYEVVFDVFKTSIFLVDNPSIMTFEKITGDNTRQVIEFPPNLGDPYYPLDQLPSIGPGRYALTMNLVFSPFDGQLALGQTAFKGALFRLFESPVPEPESWALFGAGLFGVVTMRRLRQRSAGTRTH